MRAECRNELKVCLKSISKNSFVETHSDGVQSRDYFCPFRTDNLHRLANTCQVFGSIDENKVTTNQPSKANSFVRTKERHDCLRWI
ncbi:Uncharacterised protein [Burkholderia pseudomallei]|nr:Uncharacterised protein [Burkholderia pseudomallei]CAK0464227.1 Uncharacterised protein [Burkholderia pseudomallei]